MRRVRASAALVGFLLVGWALPPAEDEELAGLEVVSNEALEASRGGFVVQGVDIRLGAEIRTYLGGELVLQTNVSWDDKVTSATTASGTLTPVDAAQLQAGILSSGGITMQIGDQQVYLANGGRTMLMHDTDGSIRNVLVNTASNVEIRQEVDVTLDMANFAPFQQGVVDQRVVLGLEDAVAHAAIGGLGF